VPKRQAMGRPRNTGTAKATCKAPLRVRWIGGKDAGADQAYPDRPDRHRDPADARARTQRPAQAHGCRAREGAGAQEVDDLHPTR